MESSMVDLEIRRKSVPQPGYPGSVPAQLLSVDLTVVVAEHTSKQPLVETKLGSQLRS